LFGEHRFLQLLVRAGSVERKTVACGLHQNLEEADACVRFKARHLADLGWLRVDINNEEIPPDSISSVPRHGEGLLCGQFPPRHGMLRDGDNEIGFAYRAGTPVFDTDVLIQEVEIRVNPR
jgi:hypothetical protein